MNEPENHNELPECEAAELESLLKSYCPSKPNLPSIAVSEHQRVLAPTATSSRAWTLAVTWVSGVLVGALAVLIIKPNQPSPTRPVTPSEVANMPSETETTEPTPPMTATTERQTRGPTIPGVSPWDPNQSLPAGSLTVGAHLVSLTQKKSIETPTQNRADNDHFLDDLDSTPTPDSKRTWTTRRDLLREFQDAPGNLKVL